MVIDVEKHTVIGLDEEESRLFDVMLKLAMSGYNELYKNSSCSSFILVNTESTSYEEIKLFIEDLMRGVNK